MDPQPGESGFQTRGKQEVQGQGQIPGPVHFWNTSPRQNTEQDVSGERGAAPPAVSKVRPATHGQEEGAMRTPVRKGGRQLGWHSTAGDVAVGSGKGHTWEVSGRHTGAWVMGADKMLKGEGHLKNDLRFLGGQCCHLQGHRGINRRILGLPSLTCRAQGTCEILMEMLTGQLGI